MEVLFIFIKVTVYIILAVQAYSDYKTKELYTILTYIAMLIASVSMVLSIKGTDIVYLTTTALFIMLQYKLKAYAFGDAKLFIVLLELLPINLHEVDILIGFLLIEFMAVIIFIFYVLLGKIIRREKLSIKEGHAYAPAIFIAGLTAIFI